MSRWLKEAGVEKRPQYECRPTRLRVTEKQRQKVKRLYSEGLNRIQVAKAAKLREHAVRLILNGEFRKPWQTKAFGDLTIRSDPLPEEKLQCILGTLLGDGCLCASGKSSYMLTITHGHKQENYLRYKSKIIGASIYKCVRDNAFIGIKDYILYRMVYSNKGCLSKIANLVFRNRKKTVNKEWLDLLTPLGLAFWYMDDGFSSFYEEGKYVLAGFSTEGFAAKEVELLRQKLLDFGIETGMPKKGKGHNITIKAKSVNRFMNIIEPYIVPCLQYKIKRKPISSFSPSPVSVSWPISRTLPLPLLFRSPGHRENVSSHS
jgi:hypothetical protein